MKKNLRAGSANRKAFCNQRIAEKARDSAAPRAVIRIGKH